MTIFSFCEFHQYPISSLETIILTSYNYKPCISKLNDAKLLSGYCHKKAIYTKRKKNIFIGRFEYHTGGIFTSTRQAETAVTLAPT